MRIEFEAASAVDDPTPEEVDQGLRGLGFPDNSFAVLELRPDSYIQAMSNDVGSFVIEYQDGSPGDHFRAAQMVRLDDVIAAFQSYLRQDGQWKSRFAWEKVDLRRDVPAPAPPRQRVAADPGRRRERPRAARAKNNRGSLSAGCLVAFYAVLVPPTIVLTVVLLRTGVQGALASTGLAGEPGRVVVTECHPTRYGGGCSGAFLPSDRPVFKFSPVSVEGWYHSGDAVNVHLLNGDAWPAGGAAAVIWIAALLFGGLFVAIAVVGFVDAVRRTWRRRPKPASQVSAS